MSGALLAAIHNILVITGEVVVTSPLSSIQYNPSALCNAGVAFAADGGVDDIGPGGADRAAFAAGEWWSEEPDAGIGSSYDVRCASISSGSWAVQAATVGTWIDMSVERTWTVRVIAMSAPDIDACTASFEIRPNGGGATLATFTVAAEASN